MKNINLNKKKFVDRMELFYYIYGFSLEYKTQDCYVFHTDGFIDGIHISKWYNILKPKSTWAGLVKKYGKFFVPVFDLGSKSYKECVERLKEIPPKKRKNIYIAFVF